VDDGLARVFVDHGFQWDGDSNVWLTRARASFVLGFGPRFYIRPRSLLSRVVGIQGGLSSGDPCFDDFFVVRTEQEVATWNALTTRVRSLLGGLFQDAHLTSNGRMVSLWREADFGRESDAIAAVELVSELVHYGCDTLDSFRTLPGASFSPPCGRWDERSAPAITVHTPMPVWIGPEHAESRTVTTARTACGRSVPPFWWEVDQAGQVRGNCGRFPAAAAGVVPQVGPAVVRCDGNQIRLQWKQLETDRNRLLAGAHLVSAFAQCQQRPLYR